MAICHASSVITQEACVESYVLLSIQDNYGNREAIDVPHPSCIGIEPKSVEKANTILCGVGHNNQHVRRFIFLHLPLTCRFEVQDNYDLTPAIALPNAFDTC